MKKFRESKIGHIISWLFYPTRPIPKEYSAKWLFFQRNKDCEHFYDWNIYGDNWTKREWAKRFNRFHFWAKIRILYPAVYFMQLVIGKHRNDQPRPQHKHDRNLVVFDRAWEKTIDEWSVYYFWPRRTIDERIFGSPEMVKVRTYCAESMVGKLKNIMMTSVTQDTAYRELFNILMFNLAIEMNKEWNTEKPKHLFYSCEDICDKDYYHIVNVLYEKKVNLQQINKDQKEQEKHWMEEVKKDELEKGLNTRVATGNATTEKV